MLSSVVINISTVMKSWIFISALFIALSAAGLQLNWDFFPPVSHPNYDDCKVYLLLNSNIYLIAGADIDIKNAIICHDILAQGK